MRKNTKTATAAKATAKATETETVEVAPRYYKGTEEAIPTAAGVAVSLSYENPAVAAARKVRRGCLVRTDAEPESAARFYTSVYKAFVGEGLPVSAHIPFRGRLRKTGAQVYPLKTEEGKTIRYLFTDTDPKPEPKPEDPEGK